MNASMNASNASSVFREIYANINPFKLLRLCERDYNGQNFVFENWYSDGNFFLSRFMNIMIFQRPIFKFAIFDTPSFSWLQTVRKWLVEKNVTGNHSFSKYVEFSEKLLFLIAWCAHVRVRYRW